ncbi:MAG TPA: ATP-binding cassette domain-containing protein, partial [Thermoanaerobaculia bacterium]|nr:ATP-binding cassette domain-containing protein [Thermoanaerobaculia bacterium]
MTAAIELENVSKFFGKFPAVDSLSLRVPRGVVYGLLGPNGAGKTTTIRMIMNITAADSGEIRVLGQPMTREMQNRIGYLPEERGLYRKMKVLDHLL